MLLQAVALAHATDQKVLQDDATAGEKITTAAVDAQTNVAHGTRGGWTPYQNGT